MKNTVKLYKDLRIGDKIEVKVGQVRMSFQVQGIEKGMKGHKHTYWVVPVIAA